MNSRQCQSEAVARPLPLAEPHCYQNRAPLSELKDLAESGPVGVRLMTGATVVVDPCTGIDFASTYSDQQRSNSMWLHSLQPLRVLGEALRAGRLELVAHYRAGWSSAVAYMSSETGRTACETVPSGDHAAATRLRACLEAGPLLDDAKLIESVRRVGDTTVSWLMEDANYRANNHGLMSSIALLYWSVHVLSGEEAMAVRSKAVERILSLAAQSFDGRGLCYENTIGYHNFNLSCYDEVLALHDAHSLDPRIDSGLRPILMKAEEALNTCVLQDGTVPTVGDSPRYKARRANPVNSSGCFPESGYGVLKNDHVYLSLICGSRSEIHKHADDSSLTLWWDGHPLIVDTGSYLYDQTDSYRRTIESTLGHSGIFLDAVDGSLRSAIVGEHHDYWASIEDFRSGPATEEVLRGSYGLGTRARVDRHVQIVGDRWVTVRDVVRFRNHSLTARAIQRWLMGPQLSALRLGHGHWWFSSGSDTPGVTILSLSNSEEELYAGEEWGRHRGWYSEQYGHRSSITGLDLASRGRVQVHSTVLAIGREPVVDFADLPSEVLESAQGLIRE